MLALIVSIMMLGFNPAVLTVPVETAPLTQTELIAIATDEAKSHHLNVEHFLKTIECESAWDVNAVGDRGTSIGLAQLHFPGNWEISTSSAKDPYIALSIMAQAWEDNRYAEWSCWRNLFGN